MATHSSVLAWTIPGMGSHRVGHDWSDLAAAATTKSSHAATKSWYSQVNKYWGGKERQDKVSSGFRWTLNPMNDVFFFFNYLFIWLHEVLVTAHGILFPDLGLNPGPLHWKQSPSHWTTGDVPEWCLYKRKERQSETQRHQGKATWGQRQGLGM